MTNYPAWKKRDFREKWKNFLAIFITIILIFAVFNGLVKSFSLKKYLGQSRWDSDASFVVGLGTHPPSVFVYKKDSSKMVILKLSEDSYFATGDIGEPLARIGDVAAKKTGEDFTRVLSLAFGTKITNYVYFKNQIFAKEEDVQNLFKNFASIETPVEILSRGINDNVKNTNITRIDLIKLWWQVKGLGLEKLEIVDLSEFEESVVLANNQKVLGVDDEALHFKISQYLENRKILEGGIKVEIVNASSVASVGEFASEFVQSVGFDAVKVESIPNISQTSKVFSKDSNDYTIRYLANIFDCDIVAPSKEADSDKITVVVGRDFASKYFQ